MMKQLVTSSLYVCMAIKHIIVLFVETPRKFITAKKEIFQKKSIESFAVTWCFHKQNYYNFLQVC